MDTPLKPAALHILAALAEGEAHGYAIMQRVRERTRGAVTLRTGSLYRHLARLIDDGLILVHEKRRRDDDPRRGAYYKLSARGRESLAAERRRLSDLVALLGSNGERA